MPKNDHLRIWRNYLKNNWSVYIIGFLMVALCNSMQVLSARVIGWIIDFFSKAKLPGFLNSFNEEDKFFVLFGLIVVSKLLLTVGRFGWRITLGRQTLRISGILKTKIWDSARFFSPDLLNTKFSKGELMNATTSDVASARFIFGWTLVASADVLFLFTLTLVSMLQINVMLTISSLLILVTIPFFIQKISRLEIERYEKAQELLSSFNDLASQAIASVRLQRVTQTGGFWSQKLYKSASQYRERRISAVKTSLLYMPILGFETLLTYGVLFFLGMNFVFDGTMTAGDFVAMQGLLVMIQDPLFELGYIISDFRKASVSLERLDNIYSSNQMNELTQSGSRIDKEIEVVLEVKNLSFTYPEAKVSVLNNMNFQVKSGDRLGVIGPIGAGKTTLIQILSGLERNISGEVLLHGHSFSHYEHEALRNHMCIVSQKPFLFADSLKNNISMGNDYSDDEIWHFIKMASFDKDVEGFDDGLETQLGEWGINLSGGQKQRLTLARALAARPKILFLDDCLSAVDTVTEHKILENLNKDLNETTLIWIAHRQSTLKYCDKIIEMNV